MASASLRVTVAIFFQPLSPIFAFKVPIFLLGLETNYDVNVIVSIY